MTRLISSPKTCRLCQCVESDDHPFESVRLVCIACRNEQNRLWRAANIERHRENARKWYWANADHVRSQHKKRHLDDPQKYCEQARKYRRPRLAVLAAKACQKRHADLKKFQLQQRAYYQRNPAKALTYRHRRRMRVLKAAGSFTFAEWIACKARYGNRCLMCGGTEPLFKLTPDHVVPVSRGGSNFINNIQPLCMPCNASKNAKTIDFRHGAKAKPKRRKAKS